MTVSQNVAYDVKSHCYVTLDGAEKGNKFAYNIGAMIDKGVDLQGGHYIAWNHPSVFFGMSPANDYIGNGEPGFISSRILYKHSRMCA